MLLPVSMYDSVLINNDHAISKEIKGNAYLRSTKDVSGYNIKASDRDIVQVEDFLVDDGNWKIYFMVIDASNWLHNQKEFLSPKWIKEIKWETSDVIITASTELVKNSYEYDRSQSVNET